MTIAESLVDFKATSKPEPLNGKGKSEGDKGKEKAKRDLSKSTKGKWKAKYGDMNRKDR